MTDDLQDARVDNALLRGSLYLTARRRKDYQEAPHFEIEDDGRPMLEVIVPPSLREQSAEVLARAQAMLQAEPEPTVNPASLQPSQARPDVTSDLMGTLDSVCATLKLRRADDASDNDVAEALRMADESLATCERRRAPATARSTVTLPGLALPSNRQLAGRRRLTRGRKTCSG